MLNKLTSKSQCSKIANVYFSCMGNISTIWYFIRSSDGWEPKLVEDEPRMMEAIILYWYYLEYMTR